MVKAGQAKRRKRNSRNVLVWDAGTYGPDGDNDDSYVGWITPEGRHIPLEPPERRNRRSTIPWDAVTGLILARLLLYGVPSQLQHGRPRQILEALIWEALDKLGVEAGKSSVAEHAKRLNESVLQAEQHWGHNES
jgi:hypothetical protein